MDRFVPRDDGSPVTVSEAWQSMDCFVPRNERLCHGEERSDAAIHLVFTQLYRMDTSVRVQDGMIQPCNKS